MKVKLERSVLMNSKSDAQSKLFTNNKSKPSHTQTKAAHKETIETECSVLAHAQNTLIAKAANEISRDLLQFKNQKCFNVWAIPRHNCTMANNLTTSACTQ